MAVDVATLYKEFNKSEILEIAKELELNTKVSQSAKIITNMILADLADEGVPEECSELMDEFLYVAGYIDDDGDTSAEWISEGARMGAVRMKDGYVGFWLTVMDNPGFSGMQQLLSVS